MRALTSLCFVIALAACDTPLGTEIARDQAKGVVNDVVEERFPGVDATPVTDCVIDNASGSEIVQIAGAAVTGVTNSTVELVLKIASRPDTIQCFVENVGPLALAQIAAATG